jgi:hypothetical protein
MGAQQFKAEGTGITAQEAFSDAVDRARYLHGHGGYTGSLAEKSSFVVLKPGDEDPKAFVDRLMDEGDERIDDKWGPAGCVKIADETYLFFGWASS